MKKFLVILVALAVTGPVLAQEAYGEPPPIVEASHNAVVAFLDLTPGQVADWDYYYRIHRNEERPLKEEIAVVQEELEELFAMAETDFEAIGELVVLRRDLGEDLIDVHVRYHESFVSVLDESQVQRLRFIARADGVQKIIPAFKLFELIPRR